MADKNFVVKNGIVVNTAFSANSSGIYYSNTLLANSTQVNATTFTGTSNNTSFVGSVSAANVVSNAQLSANLSNYQTSAGLSANVATLTANNTSFVGTVSAANVVSNAQLSANLSNYQTTTGLSANVATLTANNTSFVGSVSAANVVSNAQLSANLSNYQTTAGLNANIASYLPTYPGNINTVSIVNSATFSVGTSWTANSTRVVFGTSVAIQANGSLGTANQVLTTNGSGVYWANGGGTGSTYTKGNQGPIGDASAANNIFRINANTVSNNITFDAQDNASATGPLTVATGYTITISDGASVVIL